MRTSHRPGYGAPRVLRVRDAPVPRPAVGEVLVRVHAASVNRTDSGILRGKPFIFRFFAGFPRPRFSATGCDFAGEVVAVGDGVSGFAVGDRVYGLDDTGLGSHAQFVVVPVAKAVLQMPAGLTFADAVGCTEGAFYAVNFLNKVDLSPGQRVLVIGGTGAIGSAAIQLLAARGIEVDAVCPAGHADLVRSLGAAAVFDADRRDHLVPSEPYDFVFDAVGKSRFSLCRPILTSRGVYVSSELGPRGENLALPLVTAVGRGRRVVFPIPRDPAGSLRIVRDLVARGAFRAVIDRTYALDDIVAAFEYMESGQKIGTVVLDPWA
ncbi:MAG: NAD(P)-dependent alcohol dehydrogenase [Actinobacteria bacterium]|nr:MAG: NAD(P)-dependent alcohol dehydrogenase [Actinomycetota bacterium]